MTLRWSYLILLVFCTHIVHGLLTEAQILASQKLIRRSCKAKVKITSDEELDGLLKGKWENISPSTMCYLNCCLSMMKVISRDGHMNYDSSMKQAASLVPERQALMEATLLKCKDAGVDLADKCEIGYEIAKCFYFDNPQNYIVP
ncbi:putative odorant binding protein [Trypoxylus dichotomus]